MSVDEMFKSADGMRTMLTNIVPTLADIQKAFLILQDTRPTEMIEDSTAPSELLLLLLNKWEQQQPCCMAWVRLQV